MDRALVAISILLAAAASAAAEPPATAPPAPEATASAPPPVEPVEPATALAADASEPAVASAEAAPAPATADDADAAPTADAAAAVPTVDMKKLTDDTVCRKERPTGSLIGIMRCYSRSATTVLNDELMRRDVEEMRMRQNDQQAREAAAAMTRRRPGP